MNCTETETGDTNQQWENLKRNNNSSKTDIKEFKAVTVLTEIPSSINGSLI